MKKTKKGFTLVEIIVAIGLIGVLSAGFLGVVSNNYTFLFETKEITEDAFMTQKKMELGIETLKQEIDDGTVTLSSQQIFENVTVSYVPMSDEFDGRKFYTYVSNTRLPQIEKLKISNVGIRLKYDALQTTYAYDYAPTNLEALFTNDTSTMGDLMVNLFAWYQSKPGFNMPVPRGSTSTFNYLVDVPEADRVDRYPIFPRDYELIATATSNTILDVSHYTGSHLVLTVTPAAKSGRIGETGVSIPLHIHGLENTDDLALHLDASYIDPYDTNEVLSSTNRRVIRWYDLESNIGETSPDEYAYNSTASNRPEVFDTDPINSFVSRYVRFTDTTSLTIQNQNTSGKTVNYVALVRGYNSTVGEPVFKNGDYTATLAEIPENMISFDGWYIINGSYLSNSNTFTLGLGDIDIIELIVYDSSIDLNEITDYVKSKYVPIDSDAEIVSLYDKTETVYVGDIYTPPSTVLADMSVGADRYVAVNWNGSVDTSSVRSVILTGTSQTDVAKTMTLTVNVIEKILADSILLTPSALDLAVGETETVVADIEPEDTFDKSVIWESSDEAIVTVSNGVVTAISQGSAVVTATTGDGNAFATCAVTVTAANNDYYWPSGMVLQLDASLAYEVNDNDSISTWVDRSEAGNNFTGSGKKKPKWKQNGLNNLYTVLFDGNNDFLTRSSRSLEPDTIGGENENFYSSNTNSFTVFVVGKSDSTSNEHTFISKSGGWGDSATYALGTTDGDFGVKLRGVTLSAEGDTDFYLLTSIWGNNKHNLFVNGILVTGPDSAGTKGDQDENVTIGASNSGSDDHLEGEIAEIIVFNRNLSDNERWHVEDYLMLKWLSDTSDRWDFTTGFNDWNAQSNISSFTHQNTGIVSGNINGSDPYIVSGDNLNKNITAESKIFIRLKNETLSDQGQIYFTTTSETGFDEAKHVDFSILPNSDYTDYIINMGANPKWTGTLKQLRIDPAVNATGTFNIDFIRIVN